MSAQNEAVVQRSRHGDASVISHLSIREGYPWQGDLAGGPQPSTGYGARQDSARLDRSSPGDARRRASVDACGPSDDTAHRGRRTAPGSHPSVRYPEEGFRCPDRPGASHRQSSAGPGPLVAPAATPARRDRARAARGARAAGRVETSALPRCIARRHPAKPLRGRPGWGVRHRRSSTRHYAVTRE